MTVKASAEMSTLREYLGTERNTFIISPEGLVAKKYIGVDPKTHAAQIITDLKALQALEQ